MIPHYIYIYILVCVCVCVYHRYECIAKQNLKMEKETKVQAK